MTGTSYGKNLRRFNKVKHRQYKEGGRFETMLRENLKRLPAGHVRQTGEKYISSLKNKLENAAL